MKNKIGRNEPCPCGSGRKFKRCCIFGPSGDDLPGIAGRFRYEPGSYGGPGVFLPSIACLEQWQPNRWRYYFVLVRLDDFSENEDDATGRAAEDLNTAFSGATSAEAAAGTLKALGYKRMDDFKIVRDNRSLPQQTLSPLSKTS